MSFRLRTYFNDYTFCQAASTVRNVCVSAFYLSKFTSIEGSFFNKAFQRFPPSPKFQSLLSEHLLQCCPFLWACLITPRKRNKLLEDKKLVYSLCFYFVNSINVGWALCPLNSVLSTEDIDILKEFCLQSEISQFFGISPNFCLGRHGLTKRFSYFEMIVLYTWAVHMEGQGERRWEH